MNPSGRSTAATAFFCRSQRTSVGSTTWIVGTPSAVQAVARHAVAGRHAGWPTVRPGRRRGERSRRRRRSPTAAEPASPPRGAARGARSPRRYRASGIQVNLSSRGAHRGHSQNVAQQMVSHDGDRAVAFGDDPPGATGAPRHLGDVWFAFGLVRVEQRLRSLSFHDGGELPAQVGGIANTGRHALADPRRHRVRGIAGQEDSAHPPAVGDAHVVAVDHGPQDLDVLVR